MLQRQHVSSGSKWEPLLGYSRAVRVGGTVYVSGTVGVMADGSVPSDAYGQTKRALEIIRGAFDQAGASMEDVVRTRIFVTDIHQFEEVARSHGEIFGTIRSATTVVEVRRLVDTAYVVEIEAEAMV